MKPLSEQIKKNPWKAWALFIITLVIVFFIGLFASSIIERRSETEFVYKPKLKISDFEPRNEVWGKNYPREFQSYYQTADTSFRSFINGNANIDMLEKDPRMVILWAGYAFSKDYYQSRGHFYAVEDIRNTLRTGAPLKSNEGPQPNTCWTCKSPDVPRMINMEGAKLFYQGKWASKGHEIVNFIGCADCHDAETMNLKITRPALVESFERRGLNISNVSQQEMRTLVCAQCHVEYYFKGEDKYLTFPWDKGLTVEEIEKYYDDYQFTDWIHALSKAPMIKAQHPDYELFITGVHYKRGVSCADCHMPFISEGGQKYTNHKMMSPLGYTSSSCQVCHRQSEDTLINNVYERQKKIYEIRIILEDLICKAHFEAKAAWDANATEIEMKPALQLIRQAQWRWDFVTASHGASFHAPLEVARIIANGISKIQDARLILQNIMISHHIALPISYPDFSTKTKAQELIGIDIKKLLEEKHNFIKTVVPEWINKAKEREKNYKSL